MIGRLAVIAAVTAALAAAQPSARNTILFLGDSVGVSSLNAASIFGYGRPQALHTGVKTRNGVMSQAASAVRDVRDGDTLKTILEYAEECGLSTGIISK